ncbi:MAG: SMP-30/gluconolactonase/LRE family protein [Planctomycetota bacterium]
MTDVTQAVPLDYPSEDDLQFLPEGPVEISECQFSWVAIQHSSTATTGSLCEFDLANQQNTRYDLEGRPGFAFRQADGSYVIGLERSLIRFDPTSKRSTTLADGIDADVENTIINDGLQIGDDFVFGCKDLEFATKKAGLYLFRSGDSQLIRLRSDRICSNGKVVVEEGGELRLYDIDSPARTVWSYKLDIAAGQITDEKVEFDLTSESAVPDGMTITPDGKHLIIAMFQPEKVSDGQTRMYDRQSGELVKVWETIGSRQNTCPAIIHFEGQTRVLITTASEHMDDADREMCPMAGRFFLADL